MSEDTPSQPSSHMLALPGGYVLEGYRIERVLGEGGFGITYLGRDVESRKRVAIKELLPKEFATRTHGSQVVPHATHTQEAFAWALDSFMNEARTLAELSHPNVVLIHRLFRANGTAYMVMDYVEGQSLKDWLKNLPGPPGEATLRGILLPLLDGLEHVHEAGLLHRDIKPENIFITTKGKPVLLDFGSARVAPEGTRTMTSLVSKGYSPFELYTTRSRQTPAADLYALAATMVRAITGRPPEDATDRIADPTLTRPVSTTHRGRYSEPFLRAVDAAFAVHAADRPQSVAAWRSMLEGGAGSGSVVPAQAATQARTNHAPVQSEPSRSRVAAGQSGHDFSHSPATTPSRPSSAGTKGWLTATLATLLLVGGGAAVYLMSGKHEAVADEASKAGTQPAASAPTGPPAATPVSAPSLVVPENVRRAVPAGEEVELQAGKTMQVILPGGVKMAYCYCPPGSFMMGSPLTEKERDGDENQVLVRINKGYWLAQTEVTQEQWEAVMGTTLEQQRAKEGSQEEITMRGPKHPMYFVSWEEAQAYVEKLNGMTGVPERWKWALPSEAQWEYACRAGTRTVFSPGDTLSSAQANFNGVPYGPVGTGLYLKRTTEAGSYPANAWGLYDMHGNVWEWCSDWYMETLAGGTEPAGPATGVYRVNRGGSWYYEASLCRAARRTRDEPGFRSSLLGFRPALVSSEP